MRKLLVLLLVVSSVLASATARAGAPCTPIDHCSSAVSCTSPTDSQCTSCDSGYRLSETGPADTCPACTAVTGCQSTLTCTSAASSQCTACASGRYLQQGTADTCPTCNPVAHCQSSIACSQASNSQCTSCDTGYYLSNAGPASVCQACTTIPSCVSPGGCTNALNAQCLTCASGTYLVDGVTDTCATCAAVPGCSGPVTCTNGTDSVCSGTCDDGFYRTPGGQCAQCAAVANCNGDFTCTSPTDSVCNGTCDSGFYLDQAGQCSPCGAVPFCTSTLTCTSATDSVCTQCVDPGYYLNSGQCFACTGIVGCDPSQLSCESATTSHCDACDNHRYKDTSARPTGADTCPLCTDVPNCATQESCSTSQNSHCSTCRGGHYRVAGSGGLADTCPACTEVPGCDAGDVTCTTASDSICTECDTGKYLDPSTHTCLDCTDVANCSAFAQETCTTGTNSVCPSCEPGYWRSASLPTVCTPCTPIANCTGVLTCSSPATSHCTDCAPGYVLTPAGTECREQCTRADDCSDHGTPAANGFRPSNCGCVCDVGWTGAACDVHSVLPTPTTTPTPVETATRTATPTPAPTPVAEALNHFLCYETQQRALNRIGVIVDDDIAARTLTVKRAKRLCAPASKNGEDPTAPADLSYLSAYTIKQTSPRFLRERDVLVTPDNTIFPPITVDIVRPERLLVPAAEQDGETPPPALAAPIDLYQCYRVKGGRTRLSGVTIETDVVSGPVVVDVKRALHFCRPVHTDGSLVDPVRDLMCYQVRTRPLPQPAIRVSTTNEFESTSFNIFGLRELCVPVTRPGVCGNGRIDAVGEQCDDGNRSSNDGCSSTCQSEGCIRGRC